jgi:hypothetical protein
MLTKLRPLYPKGKIPRVGPKLNWPPSRTETSCSCRDSHPWTTTTTTTTTIIIIIIIIIIINKMARDWI